MHHNIYGGLAYHTYRMVKAAYALCEVYKLLNRELLVCGTALHDIGKLFELKTSDTGIANYTDMGNLFGHSLIGIPGKGRMPASPCGLAFSGRARALLGGGIEIGIDAGNRGFARSPPIVQVEDEPGIAQHLATEARRRNAMDTQMIFNPAQQAHGDSPILVFALCSQAISYLYPTK